jgi:hypothetical protein
MSLIINISYESHLILEKLAGYGIYGKDAQEVATRFVDEKIQSFFESKPLGSLQFELRYLKKAAREDAPHKAEVLSPPAVKKLHNTKNRTKKRR